MRTLLAQNTRRRSLLEKETNGDDTVTARRANVIITAAVRHMCLDQRFLRVGLYIQHAKTTMPRCWPHFHPRPARLARKGQHQFPIRKLVRHHPHLARAAVCGRASLFIDMPAGVTAREHQTGKSHWAQNHAMRWADGVRFPFWEPPATFA